MMSLKYDDIEKKTTTSKLQQEPSDEDEVDEVSEYDSSLESFRSSSSSSVSENRWPPCLEIEEIDQGWILFSRTSSSKSSVSSFFVNKAHTYPQPRRLNWMKRLFRSSGTVGKPNPITPVVDQDQLKPSNIPNPITPVVDQDQLKPSNIVETIMIGDWGGRPNYVDDERLIIYNSGASTAFDNRGYDAATAFDHRGYDGIKRIIIYCGSFAISSMRIQYTKRGKLEWSESVGERLGWDRHEIVLDDPREHITKVKGYISCYGRVTSLTFFTNRETYGPFGSLEEDSIEDVYPFEYSGGKLVSFKGSSRNYQRISYISSIGFYVQSPPPHSCEKCGGKYIISSATTSTSERVPNVNHQTTREIQQIISVGQFGISKSSFTPFDHAGGYDGIKRIFVGCHRKRINYLKVEYMKNGEPQLTDGIGDVNMKDSATEVVLDYPNEFLQAVTGTTFQTYGVTSLTFHSNLGKYGPFGRKLGFPFEVSRGKIIGFQGEASEDALMAIGFHVVPTKYPISLLCDTCEASG